VTGTASRLTGLYRDALGALTAGLLARLVVAWLVLWDDEHPVASAARIGDLAAPWITGAQAVAAQTSAAWLAALTADAHRVPPGRVAPFAVPAGLIGTSAAGGPLADMTGLIAAVWWSRLLGGASRADAASAAADWLGRVASSEPYRAANLTVLHNARTDPRLTGRTRREARPGACEFCRELAGRGYRPAAAAFAAHGHCRCTATPEIGTMRP
jgi:hypothetical protein